MTDTHGVEIGHEKAQSVIDSITSSYAAEGQAGANPMLPANLPMGATPYGGMGPGMQPPPFGLPGGMPPPPFGGMPGGMPGPPGPPGRKTYSA